MRTVLRLKLDIARRVLDFHRVNPEPTAAEAAHLATLQGILDRVEQTECDVRNQQRLLAEATAERDAILKGLVAGLAQLVRLAVAVSGVEGIPELRLRADVYNARKARFLPRVFDALDVVVVHQRVLERHGLPEGRLTELEAEAGRFEDAERRRQAAQAASLHATATFESAAFESGRVIRLLDAVARIRLSGDSALLAEWRRAASLQGERSAGVGVGR